MALATMRALATFLCVLMAMAPVAGVFIGEWSTGEFPSLQAVKLAFETA